MTTMVSAIIPFPNICWWAAAMQAELIILDAAEHFEKMTYRNRYYITGPNGLIQLSIPLQQGRNQRTVMNEVGISNRERWQVQHWRTLTSVYNRAPYFSFYAPTLEPIFMQPFNSLIDFNMATIHWLKQQLKLNFTEHLAGTYIKEYENATTDLRKRMKAGIEKNSLDVSGKYYQLFSERNGFLPNLSMLDLLFSEGPYALQWIKNNKELAENWG